MITSKDNDLIKLCNQIKNKKYSREHALCLIETSKIVSELYLKNILTNILVVEDKYEQFKKYTNVKVDKISLNIANYLSDTITSDGVFAICRIPNNQNISFNKCLILDRIQDPANLGAIIRSACAFGYNTIFAIDSVYPYSYKSIRSSMGYIFDVNFIVVDLNSLLEFKKLNNIEFISADMDGAIIDEVTRPSKNFALIIGNEGKGISQQLRNISDRFVSIPMDNNVESLNASVSASIIMYKLK